eukprot:CAMPEP_0198516984 /NCGR_PEP_ID=MMETSP1462-20131121/18247_1 /TAXON_ID=1333877 /ORGANISM="Brandtodinium nutriculum, Strain RCC3387" /LENGTH=78 /DNA_ID=CAMNT_0044246531 /DNA_START=48 /DNA_END=282 /DNA_ORIENTATION=-
MSERCLRVRRGDFTLRALVPALLSRGPAAMHGGMGPACSQNQVPLAKAGMGPGFAVVEAVVAPPEWAIAKGTSEALMA